MHARSTLFRARDMLTKRAHAQDGVRQGSRAGESHDGAAAGRKWALQIMQKPTLRFVHRPLPSLHLNHLISNIGFAPESIKVARSRHLASALSSACPIIAFKSKSSSDNECGDAEG